VAVENTNSFAVTATMEVDFNITPLTDGIALTNTLPQDGIQRYYEYDVTSPQSIAAAFEILGPNGNVELVASKGVPLPDLLTHDYISDNPGVANQSIIVITNEVPVPLSTGRWYLGVFNNDVMPVTYAIRATEFGPPNIITLTNAVPYTFTTPPGNSLSTFFRFNITNDMPYAQFELYNLSGNVDLDLQRDSLPYSPPFFATSTNPGTNDEQIVLSTNNIGTNLIASWYLGVPNNTATNVTYTILAQTSTNLFPPLPILVTPGIPAAGSGVGLSLTWPAVPNQNYEVLFSTNLFNWTVLTNISSTSYTITFTDPNPMPLTGDGFYRVEQVSGP
jgi:hypothetical protein